MNVAKFSKKVKRHRMRVYQLLKEGRIKGAVIDAVGNWDIPESATLPPKRRPGRKVTKI